MIETLIGGLLGGIFRIIPEILKLLDAKNERSHELSMQDKAIEFQKLAGAQKLNEITAQGQQTWNSGAIEALSSAISGQDKPSGIALIDGLSKLMRPIITLQWVIILYPAVIVTSFVLLINANIPVVDAIPKVFGDTEKGIVSAILNFWFLGRVFEKVK